MKRRWVKRTAVVLVAALAAIGVLLLLAAVSPESELGCWLFRRVYASPVSKRWLLEAYRSDLWSHEGGYIPIPTDRFLCSRLEASSSQDEINAIARFYALQASGREGRRVLNLSDGAKQKVIGAVMQNLDNYDTWKIGSALLLVEELRRGEEIWKGAFGPINAKESANWTEWWKTRGLNNVKVLYRKWWQSQTPWIAKKTINPLAGSGIEAAGP